MVQRREEVRGGGVKACDGVAGPRATGQRRGRMWQGHESAGTATAAGAPSSSMKRPHARRGAQRAGRAAKRAEQGLRLRSAMRQGVTQQDAAQRHWGVGHANGGHKLACEAVARRWLVRTQWWPGVCKGGGWHDRGQTGLESASERGCGACEGIRETNEHSWGSRTRGRAARERGRGAGEDGQRSRGRERAAWGMSGRPWARGRVCGARAWAHGSETWLEGASDGNPGHERAVEEGMQDSHTRARAARGAALLTWVWEDGCAVREGNHECVRAAAGHERAEAGEGSYVAHESGTRAVLEGGGEDSLPVSDAPLLCPATGRWGDGARRQPERARDGTKGCMTVQRGAARGMMLARDGARGLEPRAALGQCWHVRGRARAARGGRGQWWAGKGGGGQERRRTGLEGARDGGAGCERAAVDAREARGLIEMQTGGVGVRKGNGRCEMVVVGARQHARAAMGRGGNIETQAGGIGASEGGRETVGAGGRRKEKKWECEVCRSPSSPRSPATPSPLPRTQHCPLCHLIPQQHRSTPLCIPSTTISRLHGAVSLPEACGACSPTCTTPTPPLCARAPPFLRTACPDRLCLPPSSPSMAVLHMPAAVEHRGRASEVCCPVAALCAVAI
ncbi:hypothetical protein DENSPDRAFT_854598 [Dentipellis sp. KUC8613]|nr:hypothetical protein DENSPDRAFT_854598 [Dentipellis sp. KUC8613]